MNKPWLPLAFLLLGLGSATTPAADLAAKSSSSPGIAALSDQFPMLARLLALEQPWQQPAADLAAQLFPPDVKRVQGSADYPLLFAGRRSASWRGLPVWGEFADETELYAFDPARPVIRLHLGRPLDAGLQLSDYSLADDAKVLFPGRPDSMRQEIAAQVERLVDLLQPHGARRLPSPHPRIKAYALPGGSRLTLSDFSGTGRGTVYLQIDLEPIPSVRTTAGRRIPAFPGAEGYGSLTPGGRGGRVYVVTTLDDYLSERRDGREAGRKGEPRRDGTVPILPAFPPLPAEPVIPGSLREAVEASGPRIVVFAVSGTIALKSQLKIRHPYLTVAGSTAPGDGVQIRNWGLEIQTHDVVLRYLRVRVGDIKGPGPLPRQLGEQTHAIDISGLNVVVDHCEFAYANDQTVNVYAQRDFSSRAAVTFQWNYVYAGLTNSVHEGGNHSHGYAMAGWGGVSLHHNLTAFCLGRNPRVSGLRCDYRNNVLHYFWDSGYGDGTDDFLKLNYVGNVLQHGQRREGYFDGRHLQSAVFHASGNEVRRCRTKRTSRILDVPNPILMPEPFDAPSVETQDALAAYEQILQHGGASLPTRDAITRYVADSVRHDSGRPAGTTEDWPADGYPAYAPASAPADRDRDGLPDEWERRFGLDPQTADDARLDPDGDGYTNIEEFINGTDPRQFVDYRNPAHNRDLRLTRDRQN